ncbi:hypothetical protein R2R35_14725 [Anaerocolumna sp. AGMB13020]|uniref:hypothetical protein n=1 Tax=Anaerocolumna sp. AGMB13020 TaxID=3081750 RepID=UPI002955623D|nr:hypothetical protein [Anaerocolumna sp. AGMB13020]WOO35052.1 hypothetical protein R2R35_14725 [Anaerocolumna sp. AGMB13020]
MNNALMHLFANYIATDYYNHITSDIDLDWLRDKISINDMEVLKEQIYSIIVKNEEEIFNSTLKYAWNIYNDLIKS